MIDKLKNIGAKLPKRNREPVIGHSFEADNVAWPLRLIGKLVTLYIRLVELTTQVQVVGDGPLNKLQIERQPIIMLLWHGRNFQSIPVGRYFHQPAFVLTSRSRDGAIIANIVKPFGFSAIQGSGTGAAAKKATNPRKRGAQAFRSMLKHLQAGHIVAATADVPPGPVFETGPGMVRLAAKSGAAIIPIGVCGKPEILVLGTWDKSHYHCRLANVPSSMATRFTWQKTWMRTALLRHKNKSMWRLPKPRPMRRTYSAKSRLFSA